MVIKFNLIRIIISGILKPQAFYLEIIFFIIFVLFVKKSNLNSTNIGEFWLDATSTFYSHFYEMKLYKIFSFDLKKYWKPAHVINIQIWLIVALNMTFAVKISMENSSTNLVKLFFFGKSAHSFTFLILNLSKNYYCRCNILILFLLNIFVKHNLCCCLI